MDQVEMIRKRNRMGGFRFTVGKYERQLRFALLQVFLWKLEVL